MIEKPDGSEIQAKGPEAIIRAGRSFSMIWVVPVVAAIIGGWLVYKALSEKGPEITIAFETADGLEADKTKIKYKDVEVGVVKSISLNKDLSGVNVIAQLVKDSEKFLTDQTKFWVVRPRVSAGEISGLGTLMGGAYIAIDPSRKGTPLSVFTGLERPPAVTADIPGTRFILQADRLGSLEIGSPIYFRQLKVGQVEDYQLNPDGSSLKVNIFIRSPYDEFVSKNTRFWNAGGLDFTIDANGLKVDTESFVTIMLGGIAFETPVSLKSAGTAEAGDIFRLHNNYQDALKKVYTVKGYWLIRFNGSVDGLLPGAPVKFKGVQIGEVVDIDLKIDPDNLDFRVPVLIEIEAERIFKSQHMMDNESDRKEFMASLVSKGLRAQLESGNLLTGQLIVDLDFHPDAPPQEIVWDYPYSELPAVQTPLEEIFQTIADSLKKIDDIPLVEMGNELRTAVKNLNEILVQVHTTMASINSGVAPKAIEALDQTTKTLASFEKTMAADSPLSMEASTAMKEISDAARSIRVLVDYLERHPDALIYGKGKDQ